MTLAQVKLFFREVIKVVAGGPAVGTPGQNRAEGVLAALDKLAEFAAAQGGGNSTTLNLPFNAGSDNTQQVTLAATTTFTTQASTNVATATVGGTVLALPLTLAAGTTYSLTITRTTASAGAALTLTT